MAVERQEDSEDGNSEVRVGKVFRPSVRRGWPVSILLALVCDHCGKINFRRKNGASRSCEFDYCGRECYFESLRTDGKSMRLRVETCNEKYGTDHPLMSDECREKRAKTMVERYGSSEAMESDVLKKRFNDSMLEKHGVEWPSQSREVREKAKKTFVERYGVDCPSKSEIVREKSRLTCLKKYGVDNPMKSDVVKSRIDWGSPHFHSKVEDRLVSVVEERYGKDDVKRSKWVYGHPVDAYVESVDTIVELDGEYWHGLDRPMSVIEERKSPRDEVILVAYNRDRRYDETCRANGKKVVRVTDREFLEMEREDNYSSLWDAMKVDNRVGSVRLERKRKEA